MSQLQCKLLHVCGIVAQNHIKLCHWWRNLLYQLTTLANILNKTLIIIHLWYPFTKSRTFKYPGELSSLMCTNVPCISGLWHPGPPLTKYYGQDHAHKFPVVPGASTVPMETHYTGLSNDLPQVTFSPNNIVAFLSSELLKSLKTVLSCR